MDLTLRAAQHKDLEQLNELMFELHHHHHLASPEHFKTAEEIEQEKSIARYLDDPECIVYVALKGELIVGFVTGHFCELISTVSKPVQMGSIDELYVLPDYRKESIAESLFEKLERTFDDYGVQQVFVEVWDFNSPAKHFYQKMGFIPHIQWMRKSLR
ncbi:GNAT family N-acetyltransferase [Vibrio sp. 99-70-13A1]|uniref:GNAT family N-acetyltransferase n=1 Tax=Vibrio sp. 99-70-13A1 TaxID=2607601 RepID=UPI00149333F6|nr:GNAT family N-acetyltransferase [Vibrio sp. 99-70-13A1]NOH96366.1 GNAT family N-acetyltransferase [Vibrio sp. 99-70-13A1]